MVFSAPHPIEHELIFHNLLIDNGSIVYISLYFSVGACATQLYNAHVCLTHDIIAVQDQKLNSISINFSQGFHVTNYFCLSHLWH